MFLLPGFCLVFFAVFLCSCIRRCNSETIFLVLCLPNWIISFVWCCELFVSKWHFIKLFSCCLQRCQVVKALFIYFPSNLHLPNLPSLSLQIFTSSLCWSYILDSILIKSHPLILFISQTASPHCFVSIHISLICYLHACVPWSL